MARPRAVRRSTPGPVVASESRRGKAGIRMPCDRSSTWSRGGHGPQLGAARESTTIPTA